MIRYLLTAAAILAAPAEWSRVPGWRLPTAKELADSWRDRSPDRFAVVRGDFDGDGKRDEARIMISNDGQRAALVVALSKVGRKIIVLPEPVEFVLGIMGIEVLPAGKHRTACGKGYFDCQPGEPEVLDLRWDGIDYFKEESANSVFYLPPNDRAFRRVWLSD